MGWARLLKRVFHIDTPYSPNCGGGEFRIIAGIVERSVVANMLSHLRLNPQPLPKGRARDVKQDFTV